MHRSRGDSVRSSGRYDQLKSSLQNLVGDVVAQGEELDEARQLVHRMVPRDKHQRDIKSLQEHLDVLSEELSRIRSRTELKQNNVAVATAVEKLQQDCDSLKNELQRRPKLEELLKVSEQVDIRLSSASAQQKKQFASKIDLDQVLLEQRECANMLTRLESSVEGKLDKSDLSKLQIVAKRIESWGDKTEQLDEQLQELQERSERDEKRIRKNEQSISRLEQQVSSLLEYSASAARTEEVEELAHKISELEHSKTNQTQHKELKSNVSKLDNLVHTVMNHLSKLMSNVDNVSTATKEVLESREEQSAQYSQFEQTIKSKVERLESKVEQKLEIETANELIQHVDDLESRSTLLEKTSAVTMRFIEWFSKRGEVYENNAGVLERQLRELAKVSMQSAAR